MSSTTKFLVSGQVVPLKVRPNAKKNQVSWDGETLMVYTTAHPIAGKANEAVIKLIKKELGLSAEIITGGKSKIKRVLIR